MPDNNIGSRYFTTYDEQFATPKQGYSSNAYNMADRYLRDVYTVPSMQTEGSKYDTGFNINIVDPENELEELRGARQSGTSKILNGLGKAGVLTLTTVADGLIGTAVGLANLADPSAGDSKLYRFINNPFSRKMQEINEASEEWMPNYKSREDKNASFLGQFGTANFWGDSFLKNLGFTAGMVIEGLITGGAADYVMGSKALASKVPQAIANAAMKGDTALAEAISTGVKAGEITQDIIDNANKLKWANRANQALSVGLSTQGEARFEALTNSKDFFDRNKGQLDQQLASGEIDQNTYDSKIDKLKNATEGYANTDFLANAFILVLSNGMQFKNMFTRGFNPNAKIAEGIEGSIAEGYKVGKGSILSTIGKGTKNIATEGIYEEMGQFAAQKAADDFYQKRYDGRTQGSLDDAFQSIYKGLAESYGTREGWNQGLVGSLTGALGMLSIHRNEQGKVRPTWEGGVYGDIKEHQEQSAINKEAVDNLNKVIQRPDFQENLQYLVRSKALQDEKLQAAAQGDKFEVLNKENDQFLNDAMHFINAGKYDDFVDNIKAIKTSTADEVRDLFKEVKPEGPTEANNYAKVTSTLPGSTPTATETQKQYVDTFGAYTNDELQQKISNNANTMLKDAEKVKTLLTQYSHKFPWADPHTKEKLVYTAATLDNVNDRFNKINSNISSKLGLDVNNHLNEEVLDVPTPSGQSFKASTISTGDYVNNVTKAADKAVVDGKISSDEAIKIKQDVVDMPKLAARRYQLANQYIQQSNERNVQKLDKATKQEKQAAADRNKKQPTKVDIDNKEQEFTPASPTVKRNTPEVGDTVSHNNTNKVVTKTNPDGTIDIKDIDTGEIHTVKPEDITVTGKHITNTPEVHPEPVTEDESSDLQPEDGNVDISTNKASRRKLSSVHNVATNADRSTTEDAVNVRNKDLDTYLSDTDTTPEDKDSIDLSIDTSDKAKINWDKINSKYKGLQDKIKNNQPLTKDEADAFINDTSDEYNSPIDMLPIEVAHNTSKGDTYKGGIYLHDPSYVTTDSYNITDRMIENHATENNVSKGQAIIELVKQERDKVRELKKTIGSLLLQGKQVRINKVSKTRGFWNQDKGKYRNLDVALSTSRDKVSADDIILTVVDSTGTAKSNKAIDIPPTGGTPGSVWVLTDKTANKERSVLQVNPQKISEDHARILFDVYRLRAQGKIKGNEVIPDGLIKGVSGLTPNQVESLLVFNQEEADKKGNTSKVLNFYKVPKTNYYRIKYGDKEIDPLTNSIDEINDFIAHITTNKNYAVHINANGSLGNMVIALDKKFGKTKDIKEYQLGDIKFNSNDTYNKFLINNGLLKSNVTEYGNTGSLTKGSLLTFDADPSNLIVTDRKVESKPVETKQPIPTVQNNSVLASMASNIHPTLDTLNNVPAGSQVYRIKVNPDGSEETPVLAYTVTAKGVYTKGDGNTVNPALLQGLLVKKGVKYIVKTKSESNVVDINNLQEVAAPTDYTPMDFSNLGNLSKPIGDEGINTFYMKPTIQDTSEGYKIWNPSEELKWLKDKLGIGTDELGYGVTVEEVINTASDNGELIFGQFRKEGIRIAQAAKQGVGYHEGFHYVSNLLLSSEEQQKIYNEARNKYGLNNASDIEVEEKLADEFVNYVQARQEQEKTGLLGKIKALFERLYQWIYKVFTGNRSLNVGDINRLFKAINKGSYRHKTVNNNRLQDLGMKYLNMTYRGVKLDVIKSAEEFRQLTKGLVSTMMNDVVNTLLYTPNYTHMQYGNLEIDKAVKEINFDKLKGYLSSKITDYNASKQMSAAAITILKGNDATAKQNVINQLSSQYGTNDVNQLIDRLSRLNKNVHNWSEMYSEVINNWDSVFKPYAYQYLTNELSIKAIQEDTEEVDNKETRDFINDVADYEVNRKHNVRAAIKFLLSNLKKSNQINPDTGLYELAEFDEVWNTLITKLYDKGTVEEMLKTLDVLGETNYPFKQLAYVLRTSPEVVRTQFETTMRLHRHNFFNVLAQTSTEGKQIKFGFTFGDADIVNATEQSIKQWNRNFLDRHYNPTTNKVNEVNINDISKAFNTVYSNFVGKEGVLNANRKDPNNARNKADLENIKKLYVAALSKLGVNITVEDLNLGVIPNRRINDINAPSELEAIRGLLSDTVHIFSNESTIYKFIKNPKALLDEKKRFKIETILSNEKIFKELARGKAQVNALGTNTNIPGVGKTDRFIIGANTFVSDTIKAINNGGEDYVKQMLRDKFHQGSYIYNAMAMDPSLTSKVQLGTLNGLFIEGIADDGRDYLDISPIEDFLSKMMAIQNGYFVFPTLADRKTYYALKGIPTPKFTYKVENGKIRVSDEIIDIFFNYAKAERNRIEQAKQTLLNACGGSFVDAKGNSVSMHDNNKEIKDKSSLISNYHYVLDGDTYNTAKGNAFKYQLFSEFNKEGFDFDSQARTSIENSLNNAIDSTKRYTAESLSIIDNGAFNIVADDNLKKASEPYKEYFTDKEYDKNYKVIGTDKLIADYAMHNMMSSIETMMLFTGDIAFYKSDSDYNDPWDDYTKRLSVMTSSGEMMRDNIPSEFNNTEYNSTTISTQKFPSTYFEDIYKTQLDTLKKLYPNLTDGQIENMVSANVKEYKKINASDGAVIISPEFSKQIEQRRGNWNNKVDEGFSLLDEAYETLASDRELTPEEEQKALSIVFQPKKYVTFDRLTKESDTNTLYYPVYDKMSLATLFRRYSKGTYMEEVLDRMELKGKYAPGAELNRDGKLQKIHMLKFDSAVKVGVSETQPLLDAVVDKKNNKYEVLGVSDLTTLPITIQSTTTLRHQVYTDPHDTEDTLFGSQVKKVVMSDIDNNAIYNINGKPTKGSDVKDIINKSLAELSNRGLAKFKDKLFENGVVSKKALYDMLYEDAVDSGMPENIQEALLNDMSLDALSDRSWIYSKLISKLNKACIDLKLPGNQLIQVTGFASGSDGKSNNLRFLHDESGKLIGCQAKVSIQVFESLLPDNLKNAKFEEKSKWLKENSEALEGLGYRIPTQGQNSTVPIVVVDFFDNMGDVIQLPDEFVALTGSD